MFNTPETQTEEIQCGEALFNINNCIRRSLEDTPNNTGKHRITCLFDPPIKLVNGNEEQIAQVINTFVINAIKNSPQSEKVEIRTSAENNKVKVSVSDHGTGIAVGKLKTIFNPIDGSDSNLKTAAEIIDSHYGQIGAESYVDVGSTFWFTLPC